MGERWPDIPYAEWADTHAFLHLLAQMVGKYRVAHTPWVNHSWHATLYVTPRGLTTGPIPDGDLSVTIDLDLHDHRVTARCDRGREASFDLAPMSVADAHAALARIVGEVGGRFDIHDHPNELPDATPFLEDTAPRPYDAGAVARFHAALVSVDRVFNRFRTGFLGKVSPSHLFWGSFDLAVTRFSGRLAPLHPGGIPNLPDTVTREAYSHEVSSAGFWAGGMGADEAMVYSYAYPGPDGFKDADIQPDAAYWHDDLGEFVLPYATIRESENPDATLMAFLQSTYAAAADLGEWDRDALDAPLGIPGRPRPLKPR